MTDTTEFSLVEIDYTYDRHDEQPDTAVIHLFGRTPEGESEHVRVDDFDPYFYIPTSERETLLEIMDDEDPPIVDITGDIDGPTEDIDGETCTRVTVETPGDVRDLRSRFDRHLEADVPFTTRFMLDRDITSGVRAEGERDESGTLHSGTEHVTPTPVDAEPRVLTYDIEVDDSNGFPKDGTEPIISIASHDSATDEYRVWLYESTAAPTREQVLDEYGAIHSVDLEIHSFEHEHQMLMAFLGYVDEVDAGIHAGWNMDDFDVPYLLDRLDVLNDDRDDEILAPERLSRLGEVWRSYHGPNVKGVVVFDLLYAYKKIVIQEQDSYRLEDTAQRELGIGKERYSGTVHDLWVDDPARLCQYNLRDTELCVALNDQLEIIPFWREVAAFVGCELDEAPTPGQAVDAYILRQGRDEFVMPSKGNAEKVDFEGAAVFDPYEGVAENVVALDLASLYPMSMVTINASPETKVDPDEFDGPMHVAPSGAHFRADQDGFIKQIIDDLLDERNEMKDKRDEHEPDSHEYNVYDRQQGAVKVIMNSLYGVSGNERFRLYDPDAAAAVTATGREVIRFTEQCVEEQGYEVAYGDTDSVMIELGDVSREQAMATGHELEEYINDRYDEFASEVLNAESHRFELEYEKLYRRYFQAGKKKRYAGHIVWKEGKEVDTIDVVGFEYTRSDQSQVTKRVQYETIDRLVRGGDLDEVQSYLEGVIADIRDGKVPFDELAVPGGIGKPLCGYTSDTAPVRAAKYSNLLLGLSFQEGTKPKVLYLESVDPAFFARVERERGVDRMGDPLYDEFRGDPEVIAIEYADQLPPEFVVDVEEMIERTIARPVGRVVEPVGLSMDEIVSGVKQTGLSSFA